MVEADDVAGEDQAYNTFLEEPAILDKHKAAAVIANGKSKHKSSCTHPPTSYQANHLTHLTNLFDLLFSCCEESQ